MLSMRRTQVAMSGQERSPQGIQPKCNFARVTSPKGAKTRTFAYFFMVLRVQDHVQGLLQALKFNFLSKMPDLDAYVSSYVTFRRF